MSVALREEPAGQARFRIGMSAKQAHHCMQRALADLRRAEKNAVLCFAEIMRRRL
jgi:hypothetical protein